MQTVNVAAGDSFLVEQCATCHGIFFDPDELEALLDETVATTYQIDYEKLARLSDEVLPDRGRIRYRKCPVCQAFMNRVSAGARSGVVTDRCRDHGVWLDGGELRRLFEWRRAGGQLHHEKVAEQKPKPSQAFGERSAYPAWDPEPSRHASGWRDDDDELVEVLISTVFRFFGR